MSLQPLIGREEAYDAAYAEGKVMTMEEAIALALAVGGGGTAD